MTTFAALFGGLPIALGQGAGSELRRPLGIAIVGGLVGVAMADPLHDADHLSLSRTLCALGRPPVSAVARGGRRWQATARPALAARAPSGARVIRSTARHQAPSKRSELYLIAS